MKIVIDMNLSPSWLTVFKSNNIEAVHWSEIGPANAKDAVIMKWARDNAHVVLTHDLDFGTLLALTKANGPSVIQLRTQDVLPGKLALIVISVIEKTHHAIEGGSLITIDETRSRVRILPL